MKKDELLKDLEPYKVNIPEKYFYNVEDIIRFVITYNFQTYSDKIFLEEWLIKQIIIPLNDFYIIIKEKIKDPTDKAEINRVLENYFMKGEKFDDTETKEELEFACSQLVPIWHVK
jgi:hypothetical protein